MYDGNTNTGLAWTVGTYKAKGVTSEAHTRMAQNIVTDGQVHACCAALEGCTMKTDRTNSQAT